MPLLALALAGAAGASPPRVEGASANAPAACAGCHGEIAREWETSLHHRSASDPSYERALAREPLAFCRGCHAPSANPQFATPAAARERGIGCVDCHAGLPREHGGALPTKTSRTSARACSTCHEFSFPDGTPHMQKTATEHQRSQLSDVSCASCHMERGLGARGSEAHVDHRFSVPAEMLSRALVADVARAGPTRVAFRLKAGEVGHAFPTGDLFRRLVVQVDAANEQGLVISRARRYLARHFGQKSLQNGSVARIDLRDDRVGADLEPCFELDVGLEGDHRPLQIEIAYERVDHPRSERDTDAVVEAHIPLSRFTLDPSKPEEPAPRPCSTR